MTYTYNRTVTARARGESYSYNEGPKTPWGRAQHVYHLARGVRWVDTPGHGGLGVANGVARRALSPAARRLAMSWGGSFWYEEDVQYAIAFYERPEWQKALASVAGGPNVSKERLEDTIRRYFPKYFEMAGLEDKPKLSRRDKIRFLEKVNFGRDSFGPGDTVEVYKVTPSSITFVGPSGLYRMPYRYYEHDEKVELVG